MKPLKEIYITSVLGKDGLGTRVSDYLNRTPAGSAVYVREHFFDGYYEGKEVWTCRLEIQQQQELS